MQKANTTAIYYIWNNLQAVQRFQAGELQFKSYFREVLLFYSNA